METITIFGVSDDLIEVSDSSNTITEEYNNTSGKWKAHIYDELNGDTAILYVDYRDNGVWVPSVSLYDEDYTLPDWNFRIIHDHELCRYSAVLQFDVPDINRINLKEIK